MYWIKNGNLPLSAEVTEEEIDGRLFAFVSEVIDICSADTLCRITEQATKSAFPTAREGSVECTCAGIDTTESVSILCP